MKERKLWVALILLLLLPITVSAATATDEFDFSTYAGANGTLSLGSLPSSSGAVYGGSVTFAKKPTKHATMSTSQWVYVTSSPGTAKTVSITWRSSGNTASESILKVYGKHSAFSGGETPSDLGTMEGVTLIGSDAYTSGSYTADIDVTTGYEFIAIATGNELIDFTYIAVEWTVPDVTNYSIGITQTGSGYVWVEDESRDEVTEAPAGKEMTIYFYGIDDDTELHSFSVYGASAIIDKTLSEDEYSGDYAYTFTMPEHDVDINAVLAAAPSPARSPNPISVNGVANTYEATLQSGVESTFTISTAYNAGTSPAYNKTLKSVTSARGRVAIVDNTYSSATGTGILTLRGLTTGSDVITITTYQTNGTIRSTRNINVTVTSRNVALITELNGKYYAVKNNPSGSTVAGVELFKQGEDYYYKSAGDLSDITWKAENTNAAGTKFYYRNSAGKYLTIDAATMSLESSAYSWSLNADAKLITGYLTGLCYDEEKAGFRVANEDVYRSLSSVSACAQEIPLSSLHLATEYTRGLTDGNYATMCLPYSVSRSETFFSGVDVYRITGKYMSGDKLTGIEMEEVEDALVAGTPYVILATASSMSVWHGANEVEDPVAALGLVGKLSADVEYVPVGCYGIASNQLRRVAYENTAKVGQYKAYIDITDVPNVSTGTPSPKRRALYVENASSSTEEEQNTNEEQIATSIEDLLNNMTPINWNEPVYNMLGQRVGQGTTGVLIQNGQKFIVQ